MSHEDDRKPSAETMEPECEPNQKRVVEMLTPRAVARLLAISLSSTYLLLRSGQLPHYRIGGAIRVSLADVETFLASCRSEQPIQVVASTKPRLKHIKLSP